MAPTASAAAPPAGPATEPNDGPGATIVARRRHEQRAEVERALGGPCLRPVGERGVRLDDAGHRHSHGVVRVAVTVRIDCALEAGEQLVAARIDELAAVGDRLPAGDADREDGHAGRDTVQTVRAPLSRR